MKTTEVIPGCNSKNICSEYLLYMFFLTTTLSQTNYCTLLDLFSPSFSLSLCVMTLLDLLCESIYFLFPF